MTGRAAPTFLLWDLPTRIVHWAIAALVPFSWWSATHDHLPWHRLSGYVILGLLTFRLAWGFAGHGTARFATFLRGPRRVLAHLRGEGDLVVGHTPLGGWSITAMLAALCVQVGLGLFSIDEDALEPGPLARFVSFDTARAIAHLHHLNFWLVVALIGLHLGAIAVYEAQSRRLTWPMIVGRAPLVDGAPAPRQASLAAFVVAATGAFALAWWIAHGLRLPFGPRH